MEMWWQPMKDKNKVDIAVGDRVLTHDPVNGKQVIGEVRVIHPSKVTSGVAEIWFTHLNRTEVRLEFEIERYLAAPSAADPIADLISDLYDELAEIKPPKPKAMSPAVNNHVCPTCKNARCSKSEITCWRCGNRL